MADLLSHPFRLLPNGKVATRDENSDEYIAERIAMVLATAPGERITVPMFGIDDPVYDQLVKSALEVQCELFRIPVRINSVESKVVSNEQTDYYIDFERVVAEDG